MLSTSYLLKGGSVVTIVAATDEPRFYKADVLVQDSIIKDISPSIQVGPEVEVIDVEGKWIMPGMVDLHRSVIPHTRADRLLTECIQQSCLYVSFEGFAGRVSTR